MKITARMLLSFLCIYLFAPIATAQNVSEQRSVQIDIESFADDSVRFSWKSPSTDSTSIYRKLLADTGWTLLTTTTIDTFTDNTIATATEYEYKFVSHRPTAPTHGYGYKAFGVKVPKKDTRGNILVLLDSRFTTSLADQMLTLKLDLISDGWNPILVTCSKDSSHTYAKAKIDSVNAISPLEGVYLIGHIPVPYSGFLFPDGHPDHAGAWPTDLYYVTDATLWSDNVIDSVNMTRPQNTNEIGDEKYDNFIIPEDIFAPVSRVDFFNLPLMVDTEEDRLIQYLNEASKYKHGEVSTVDKGLIDNNLVNFTEGFSFNGYMNFSSLFGTDSVVIGDMLTDLSSETYKWTYACGFGADTLAVGVGSISQFRDTDYKGIFSMIFGSYFGDWNTQNNLMRATMANGKILTQVWAGRPNYFFHHMGLNQPIGLSAKLSINNNGDSSTSYDSTGYGNNFVHMALLGDLSLRNKHNPTIKDFAANFNSVTNDMDFTWTAPNCIVTTAYEIYVAADSLGPYTLQQSVHPDSTSYNYTVTPANYYYYIKTISLDTTQSGSYFNNSLGQFISINATGANAASTPVPVELISFTATKVSNKGLLAWSSAQEFNFSHYDVQKSYNTRDWSSIGIVNGNNTLSQSSYQLIDNNLHSGDNYYRLKMVDFDKYVKYSDIRVLHFDRNVFSLYPNPILDGAISIEFEEEDFRLNKTDIRVTDSRGNTMDFDYNVAKSELKIDGTSGVYFISVSGITKRIIKL